MSDHTQDEHDEPVEDVVRDTVAGTDDDTTRREAVELELQERGRSDEGTDVDVSEIADEPAAGVLDDDLDDPPEPSEPG